MADWLFDFEDNPGFFIYDRTAAIEETDDPKDAILFPQIVDSQTDCDHQINLISLLIGFVNKFDLELARSKPSFCRLSHATYAFLHVGKYTLCLRGKKNFPNEAIARELEIIYAVFCVYYGGFSTASVSTKKLPAENPDRELVLCFEEIIQLLKDSLPSDVLRVVALGLPLETNVNCSTTSVNGSLSKAVRLRVNLLLQSQCEHEHLIGALALYEGQLISQKGLGHKLIDCLSLVMIHQSQGIGSELESNVNDVVIKRCYISTDLLANCTHSCFQEMQLGHFEVGCLIHLKGKFSMSLLVCYKHYSSDQDFLRSWQMPCTNLRSELLQLGFEDTSETTNQQVPRSHIRVLQTDKQTRQVQVTESDDGTGFFASPSFAKLSSIQVKNDGYLRSLHNIATHFNENPSCTEVSMQLHSGQVASACNGQVTQTFSSQSVNDVSAFSRDLKLKIQL